MDMMTGRASCLIKSREFYIGFPPRFSHYPQGMETAELEELHAMALEAMDSPGEIPASSGGVRRVVVGTGKYLILGMAGYFRDLVTEAAGGNPFVDKGNRKSLCFAALVWDLKRCHGDAIPNRFPTKERFSTVLEEQIVGHWMDSDNSLWAERTRAGVEVPYCYEAVPASGWVEPWAGELNRNRQQIQVFDRSLTERLLQKAVLLAGRGERISLCTDLSYFEEGSCFLNVTGDVKDSRMVLPNPKYVPQKPVFAQTPAEEKRVQEETVPEQASEKPAEQQGWIKKNFQKKQKTEKQDTVVWLKVVYDMDERMGPVLREYSSLLFSRVSNDYNGYEIEFKEPQRTRFFPSRDLGGITDRVYEIMLPEGCTVEDFRGISDSVLAWMTKQNKVVRRTYDYTIPGSNLTLQIEITEAKQGRKKYAAEPQEELGEEEPPKTGVSQQKLIQQLKKTSSGAAPAPSTESEDLFNF